MEDFPDLHPDVLRQLQGINDEMDAALTLRESIDPAALDEVMNKLVEIPETPPTPDAQVLKEMQEHIDSLRTPVARELIAIWDEPQPSRLRSFFAKIHAFGDMFRLVRYLSKLPDIDFPNITDADKE